MNHQSGVSFGTDEVGLHSLRGVGNTNDFASLCDDSGSTPTRTSRNPYSLGNRDRFRSDRQEGFRRVAMSSQFFSAEQNHHTAWDVAGAATQGVFRVTTVPPSGESSRIAKHTAASNDVDTHSSSQTRTAHASSSSSLCGSSGRGTGHLEKIANENVEETERIMRSSAPKSSQGYELDDAFDFAYRDLQSSTSPSSTLIGKNQAVLCQKKTTEVVEEDEFDF